MRRLLHAGVACLCACAMAVCLNGCGRARVLDSDPGSSLGLERSIVSTEADEDADSSSSRPDEDAYGQAQTDDEEASQRDETARATSAKASGSTRRSGAQSKADGDSGEKKDKAGTSGDDVDRDTETGGSDEDDTKRDPDADSADEDAEQLSASIKKYTDIVSALHQSSLYPCEWMVVYYDVSGTDVTWGTVHRAVGYLDVNDINAVVPGEAAHEPDIIVKVVASSVLGAGVESTDAAQEAVEGVLAHEGWESVPAVETGRVVAVSQDLFDSEAGCAAFQLYLAMYAYPDIYGDLVDKGGIDYVYRDMTGSDFDGVYVYPGES